METVYTIKEVAEMFKIDKLTVSVMLREGRLKGFKIGNVWRIKESDLLELMNTDTAKEDDGFHGSENAGD